MTKKGIYLLIFLAALLLLNGNRSAAAQSAPGWSIQVNQVKLLGQSQAVHLSVVFGLLDERTGKTAVDQAPESAQVTLNGLTTPASLRQPDEPIYISLLLDSSGSMSGARDRLKQAAKLTIRSAPKDAWFSIVQFDEDILMLEDFTQNTALLEYAIDQYKVVQRGTCLYDAGYLTVEAMKKIQSSTRRAVILFTDGRDEKPDGKTCSRRSYRDLSSFAAQEQTPINTIGMSQGDNRIDAAELKNLAAVTGGISVIGSQADLQDAFNAILQSLKNQWLLEAKVYPQRGENEVLLHLQLKDGTVLQKTIRFTAGDADTASPVWMQVADVHYDENKDIYNLGLLLTNPQLVDYIKVAIWDQNGTTADTQRCSDVREQTLCILPTTRLIADHTYRLVISAIGAADHTPLDISRDSQGNPIRELDQPVKYDPPKVTIKLQSFSLDQKDVLLLVSTTNGKFIKGYTGYLMTEQGNETLPGTNFSKTALEPGNRLRVEMGGMNIPSGKKYIVNVQALGVNDRLLDEGTLLINYPRKSVSIFDKLLLLLRSSWMATGLAALLFTLACGAVTYLVARGRRPRSSLYAMDQALEPGEPGALRPSAALVCLRDSAALGLANNRFDLDRLPYTIGRSGKDCLLEIPDRYVSGRHARIEFDRKRRSYTITDLGSSNGTTLKHRSKENRLAPNTCSALAPGDLIDIGPDLTFRFEIE